MTSTAGRVARRSAGLAALFIVVLVVVGIGMGVPSVQPQAPVYSAAQQAQLDAEARYRALAGEARAAATAAPSLAGMFGALADDLAAQSDAVALPRSPASPAAQDSLAAPDAATASATASPPVDGARVVALLRDSALRSLRDAGGAEPGPARVLASAGANQWRHAVMLGAALGADPGMPPADAVPGVDLAPASGSPGGAAPADCAGTPLGLEADRQALLGAKTAEDQARFGYEVAAALLPEAVPLLARSAAHAAAADAAAHRLEGLCVEVAPAPAGFVIDQDFRADPASALLELEEDHVGLYAGLVATVGPDTRPWAVASYNAAVQRSIDAGTPLVTFPGLEDGAAAAPDGSTEPADG